MHCNYLDVVCAEKIPATFTLLGIKNETAGSVHGLHTNRFQLDESVLHIGSALHTDFALNYLRRGQKVDVSREL
jgi:metal-dependent amidase/aminoacylase/carboxypeptidase family protein